MKRNRLANINEEEAMSKSTESSSTTGSVSSSSSSSSDEGSDGQKGSDSDTSSEEFFDAEEPNTGTMLRYTRKVLDNPRDRIDLTTLTPAQIDSSSSAEVFFSTPSPGSFSGSGTLNASTLSILSKSEMEEEAEEERRRKRLEEMRRRLNTDEIEEPPNDETSPSDSQTSSVEGLYGAISGKTSHPFKVVDHDTVSMQSGVSVGRMGRIMGNQSSSSNNFGTSASNHQSQHYLTHLPPAPMSISLPSSILTTTQQLPIHPNFSPVLTPRTSNNSTTTTSSSSVSSEHVPSITKSATAPGISTSSTPESTRRTNEGNYINTCTKSAPEPDLVASCMNKDIKLGLHGRERGEPSEVSSQGSLSSVMKAPVAPPRRKRNKGLLSKTPSSEDGGSVSSQFTSKENTPEPLPYQAGSLEQFHNQQARRPTSARFDSTSNAGSALSSPNPPSPTVSIRSVCRDLDKTLESSIQKIFVVKAQDEVQTRAKSSGPKVLRRTESLPKDVIAAFDPSGTGSGGHRDSSSNSNSSTLTSSTNATMNPAGDVDDSQSLASETSTPSLQPALISSPSTIETPKSKSNSAPKTSNLSSVISAMAAMEEKHDHQFNLMIRTRTDSGKFLSDLEILEQVQVLNLDTGERVPLSIAEDKIPKCINPLSLHIMRLTSEYACERNKERDSDEESMDSKKSSAASQEDGESSGVRKKTAQVRRFLGSTVKKTVDKAKSLTQRRHVKEDVDTNEGILLGGGPDPLVKMKASHSHKGPYDFDQLQQVQDLYGEHSGPVWCMKFSNCGRLLATAGQDKIIRIWVLKDHLPYFQDMRTKNTSDKVSPTPSQESIVSQHSHHSAEEMIQACENSDPKSPFVPRPLCVYSGHTADLLDIAWSKSFFLLSSSMDRTVRLWHISRRECLCCFQHIDFVTAIAFHPRDDRYFLSGSLDGKLRLWNIPDKKVALWNEVNGPNNLITAANFCQNGKFAVVGTYDGRCIFYHTEQLKYHTQIIVHKRKRLSGRKITGIEPMPGEDKILVTSNDSRIRMYDLRDLSLTCKYKGFTNSSSQIKGTVSHDGKYIVSGSENQCVYIWKTNHDYSKFSSARRDRNGYWEGIKAHNAVVTSAVFAPDPDLIVKQIDNKQEQEADKQQRAGMVKSPSLTKSGSHQSQSHTSTCPAGYVLVSADFSGCIKVFFSKVKPKHSSLPASALV